MVQNRIEKTLEACKWQVERLAGLKCTGHCFTRILKEENYNYIAARLPRHFTVALRRAGVRREGSGVLYVARMRNTQHRSTALSTGRKHTHSILVVRVCASCDAWITNRIHKRMPLGQQHE